MIFSTPDTRIKIQVTILSIIFIFIFIISAIQSCIFIQIFYTKNLYMTQLSSSCFLIFKNLISFFFVLDSKTLFIHSYYTIFVLSKCRNNQRHRNYGSAVPRAEFHLTFKTHLHIVYRYLNQTRIFVLLLVYYKLNRFPHPTKEAVYNAH